MPAPAGLLGLVERFRRNRDDYRSGRYKEAQLRREFIDPFFKLLEWDVDNSRGLAEAYKDVIHEDAIKVGVGTKAPDYCFRIGGAKKFFVEAKKPSHDIKHEVSPAYQLRRYAWSAKLPVSVLTDFEEFAVYDCRKRPGQRDRASKHRVRYYTFEQYAEKWDDIAGILSKDAVLKGDFDRFVERELPKRGTAEVDDAFLKEIERWREELAKDIARRNRKLTQKQVNFAVQRTIDRIIFLRICADRGIEDYTALQALLNGTNVYRRLFGLFAEADVRYNSGLFHFEAEKGRATAPDELTPRLRIDDKVLKEIIKGLYYPESPYEFSVLPADILGQVYEQFLGKVIRLTAGHNAKVEYKPEVRKAGGVYYTPTYIVEYIVKNTVGKLLEKARTPQKAAKLRILDPACGSGSFLLGAYQHLLDWHLAYYSDHNPEKWRKGRKARIYQGPRGDWRLTVSERKRILVDNIYGVDIDEQAVEVTKLSLLLKVVEDASGDLLQSMLFHRERALPDLGSNIKCGNSLIGTDYWEGRQEALFDTEEDEEERLRVNAFDWEREFPEVFKGRSPGFDAVIGNPPYIRMEMFKDQKRYLREQYACHDERSDLYAYFIEQGHRLLLPSGRFGMIVSNKFLRANYGKPLRDFIRREATIERIADFAGLPVFGGATVRTLVLITARGARSTKRPVYSPPVKPEVFKALSAGTATVADAVEPTCYKVDPRSLDDDVWSFARPEVQKLLAKLKARTQPLTEFCEGQICMGVKSGLTEAFTVDAVGRQKILARNRQAGEIVKPFLNGRDVRRYSVQYTDIYLLYTYHGVPIDRYPAVQRHLEPFKDRLKKRATQQQWYELQQPQYNFAPFMDKPKIIFPDIATTPRFALDETGYYSSNTTYFIPRADLYLLGLLNSQLGFFYFSATCAGLEGKGETYLRFFGQYLEGFPICTIDFSKPKEKVKHDRMVKLVQRMLDLNKKLPKARTAHERTVIERDIAATDRRIDLLVYELYGLTKKEIAIVEEATG